MSTETDTPEGDEHLQNPLDLSDEEIMEMPEPEDLPAEGEDAEPEEKELKEDPEPKLDPDATEEVDDDTEEEEDEQTTPDSEPFRETTQAYESDEDTPESEEVDKKSTQEVDNKLDYEAEYKKLLQPFKASGREVQIKNVDEALRLMQMGADYNKKMAGLKPNLKLLKMLENNGILEETKLSYLIDLDKKNPQAITKLLKDSGVDPLDVDVNVDTEYKPSTYTVDDKQVELDSVLDDIKDSDGYDRTIDIIGNKWDESSRVFLYENPAEIKFINEHIANGTYDQVNKMVQDQRMLGNLTGVSDVDAYRNVGNYMQQNKLFKGQQSNIQPNLNANVTTETTGTVSDPKLKNRKKAASATKAAPSKKEKTSDFNPLALSDEEFARVSEPQI